MRAFPRIEVVALILLLAGRLQNALVGQPPRLASAVERDCLGPQLVAVLGDEINVDPAAADRQEAACAGFVLEVGGGIGAADEDGLPWGLDDVPALGRPEAVGAHD